MLAAMLVERRPAAREACGLRRLDRWGALLDNWETTDNLGGRVVGPWAAADPAARLGTLERLAAAAQPLAAAPGPGRLRLPGAAPRRRRLVAAGDRHRARPGGRPGGGHPQGDLLGAAGPHRTLPRTRSPPSWPSTARLCPPSRCGRPATSWPPATRRGSRREPAAPYRRRRPGTPGGFGCRRRRLGWRQHDLGSRRHAGLLRAGDGGGGGGLRLPRQPGKAHLPQPPGLRLPRGRLRGGAQGRHGLRPPHLPFGRRHPRPRRPGGRAHSGGGGPRGHGGVRPQGGAAGGGRDRGLQRVRRGGPAPRPPGQGSGRPLGHPLHRPQRPRGDQPPPRPGHRLRHARPRRWPPGASRCSARAAG